MLAVAFPAALLGKIGYFLRVTGGATDYAIRPANRYHVSLAVIRIGEEGDRLLEGFELFHALNIQVRAWLVKYIITVETVNPLDSKL